jgi:hypothetical protein
MPVGQIRSRPSGTVARSPRPQCRCSGLHRALVAHCGLVARGNGTARLSGGPHHSRHAGRGHARRRVWIEVDGGLRHCCMTPARGQRGDDVAQVKSPHRRRLGGGGTDGVDGALRLGWWRRSGSATFIEDGGGGGVRAATERSMAAPGGAAMRKKQQLGGLTGAEATKHGRAATALDSAVAASDRAGRERGAVGCGFRHRSGGSRQPGTARSTPGGGSALKSGPGVERERLTGGTPRQILF